MLPELQPRSFCPYISLSSSTSAPSFSPFSSHSKPNHNNTTDSQYHGNTNTNYFSSSRSLKNPSAFAYNYRIAIALIPSTAFLLDLGDTTFTATLAVSLMISYILNSLNLKPVAFFVIWFDLVFAQLAAFFTASSSLFAAFNSSISLAAFFCARTNFLVSLQFKWLLMENPSVVIALKHLLFACLPITASSLFA